MKLQITIFCYLILYINSYSQSAQRVDQIVKSYPKRVQNSEDLAHKIRNDFKTDDEKVRAIYGWLSLNIAYNYYNDHFDLSDNLILSHSPYEQEYLLKKRRQKKVNRLLRTGKGVCIDYSYTFKELCDKLNIKSKIIVGFSKTTFEDIGNIKGYKDHAWNAVYINNKWKLIDATWGAVYSSAQKIDFYYFYTDPNELIKTHFPLKNKWQLTESLVSLDEFFNSPLFYPHYFIENIKIENARNGFLKAEGKKIKILFDSIPNDKDLYYTFQGDKYAKPIRVYRTKSGNYVASIQYKKNKDPMLTLFSNKKPIIGFKIR